MKLCTRIALLSVLAAGLLFSANPKIARDLTGLGSDTTVDVILRYKIRPTDEDVKRVEDRGGRVHRSLGMVRGLASTVSASSLEDLAADPNVEFVGRDHQVKATMDYAVPTVSADVALKYGYDGRGITVAVIDSGILDSHPDLDKAPDGKRRVVYQENFVAGAKETT
jgi:subtilisin family serine protease